MNGVDNILVYVYKRWSNIVIHLQKILKYKIEDIHKMNIYI